MPRGLFYVAGSERRILSYPDSSPSQTILEIRIRMGGLSLQGPAVWAVPGSPHFYMMHGCGSLPSETDGNLHTQLPRQLAHSGLVAGGFDIAQDPLPQPLRLPGGSGSTLPRAYCHPANGIFHGYRMTATVSVERATSIQRHAASCKEGTAHPLKAFQKMLSLMAAASPVLWLGMLRMRPIQFWLKHGSSSGLASWTPPRNGGSACVSALTRWRNPLWLKGGVTLDTTHRRKVVTTDASNKGWGALCEGKRTFGL